MNRNFGLARRRGAILVAGAAIFAAAWMMPDAAGRVEAASAKITICHRTHSTTNPYRRITVNQNAVQHGGHGGHDLPNGSTNPEVYDPTFTYVPNNKYWADIIPGGDAQGLPYNGSNPIALNWTTAGKADFFGSYCGGMTPTEFYNAEIAAGQTSADIIADLNEQDANEDIALLAALGGTFSAGNIASWSSAVTVTTLAASDVAQSTATLNGTLTVGTTSTATTFQWGTTPTLTTFATEAATPSPVTNTTAVSAALSGLAPGTTYYFRTVGTTNAGLDTEGILSGEILSFQTDAATTTTTAAATTTTAAATTTTAAATTTTAAATTTTAAATTTTAAATTTTAAATTTTAPATTTTASQTTTTEHDSAPPSTTAPTTPAEPTTTVAVGELAGVHGIVWFDRNHDGAFNGTEWVLPGVTVNLASTHAAQGNSPLRTSAASTVRTAVTGTDGSYQFNQLAPGAYTVTANAIIEGFDYTSDTDGALDWAVAVEAVANTSAVADFAGLGRGEVLGQVFDSATLEGLPFASITCHWSGFDDVAGTNDDVNFQVTADASGSFDMTGVPYGFFTCDGLDTTSGRSSAPAEAVVFSPEAVHAPLPIAQAVPPRTVAEPPSGGLPETGTDSSTALTYGCALTLAGSVLVIGMRRRPRRAPQPRS